MTNPASWTETTLGVIALGEHGLVDGPFGSNLPASAYTPNGVPVIRGSNLSLGQPRFIDSAFAYVSDETAAQLARSMCRPGDVVFTKKGTIGQTGFVPPQGRFDRYLLSSNQMKLSVNPSVAESLFVYYFVSSPAAREKIRRDASITGVPKTNVAYLKEFPIRLPSLPEQRAIARILGALDDKIELNRRTNATLEATGRALFKSWFVDFEPVRAKAEGCMPVGVASEIAACFPDGFAESELGRIPQGWRVSSIRNLVSKVQYGLTQSATSDPVGPRFLRITDIQGGRVDWGTVPYCTVSEEEHEKYRLHAGDILVARTGASTGENIYLPVVPDAVFASYLVRFQCAEAAVARFIGAFMRTRDYFEFVQGSIGGSAQPNASAQVLAAARVISPGLDVARIFCQILAPLDRRIAANREESRTLASLRDALLPKVISGAIRVRDAERVAEEAL